MAPWDILQPAVTWMQHEGMSVIQDQRVARQTKLQELFRHTARGGTYSEAQQASWQQRMNQFLDRIEPLRQPKTNTSISKSSVPPKPLKMQVATWLDPFYPDDLRELDMSPPVVYANHDWREWSWSAKRLAVIGSREMSLYGQAITQEYVAELVIDHQVGIVSGGARGVDIEAQHQALKSDG